MIDELNQYQSVTNDIEVLKMQHEELYLCKFILRLNSQLKPLLGHLLAGEGGSLFIEYFLMTVLGFRIFYNHL